MRKFNITMAIIWAVLAIISVIKGDYFIAALELVIALHDLDDAREAVKWVNR